MGFVGDVFEATVGKVIDTAGDVAEAAIHAAEDAARWAAQAAQDAAAATAHAAEQAAASAIRAAQQAAEASARVAQQAVEAAMKAAADAAAATAEAAARAAADALEATAQAARDAAEATAHAVADAAEATAQAAQDAAEATAHAVAEAAKAAAKPADAILKVVDTTVLDPLDTITGGLVDIDYTKTGITANVGIPGVYGGGIAIGENGVDAHAENPVFGVGAGIGPDGRVHAEQHQGVDWGPLPYAEGHIEVGPDGAVSVGAQARGVIPTPIGLVDADFGGHYDRNADGSYSTGGHVDATIYTPSGAYGGAVGAEVRHERDGDTSVDSNLGVNYDDYKGTAVNLKIEQHHIEDNGTTIDHVKVDGELDLDDVHATANVDVQHEDSAAGSRTTVDVKGSAKGADFEADGHVNVERKDNADGSSSTIVRGDGGFASGETKIRGEGGYHDIENADGSTDEGYDGRLTVDAGEFHGEGAVDADHTRDGQGNERETFVIGARAKAGDFEGGAQYGHEREVRDGVETEHTSLSGDAHVGEYGGSAGYDKVTQTNPDGTTTSITRTTGQIDGLDTDLLMDLGNQARSGSAAAAGGPGAGAGMAGVPGLPEGGSGMPDLDLGNLTPQQPADMIGSLAASGDLSDVLAKMNLGGGLPSTPDVDDLPGLDDFPDLDSIPGGEVLSQIPGAGAVLEDGNEFVHDVATSAVDRGTAMAEDLATSAMDLGQDLQTGMPGMPDVPAIPDIPEMPAMPDFPDVPADVLEMPDVPAPPDPPSALEAIGTFVEQGGFDEFTGDIVSAEITEAAADELWDDLD